MSIGEKASAPPPAHRIVLSDRQHLAVSGVEGVESFDEATIVLTTSEGTLTYEEEEPHQSLFGRLFRG